MTNKYKLWHRLFWASLVLFVPMVIIGAEIYTHFFVEYGKGVDFLISVLIPAAIPAFCDWKRRKYKVQ